MAGHCPEYQSLSGIRTVFTIHNGEYQGGLTWDKAGILPYFPPETGRHHRLAVLYGRTRLFRQRARRPLPQRMD
jgi:glycogen synthase